MSATSAGMLWSLVLAFQAAVIFSGDFNKITELKLAGCSGEDQWDLAYDLQIASSELASTIMDQRSKYHSKRAPVQRLTFRSMGSVFSMDLDENKSLLGPLVSKETTLRAFIGRNLKATHGSDGKPEFVPDPLARFLLRKEYPTFSISIILLGLTARLKLRASLNTGDSSTDWHKRTVPPCRTP